MVLVKIVMPAYEPASREYYKRLITILDPGSKSGVTNILDFIKIDRPCLINPQLSRAEVLTVNKKAWLIALSDEAQAFCIKC